MSHSTDWAADENSSAVHQDVQAAAESFKIFLKVWNIFSLEMSDRQSHGLLAAALQCEVLDQSDDISVNIIVSCWWAHWDTRDLLTPALSRHNEHIPLVALSDVSVWEVQWASLLLRLTLPLLTDSSSSQTPAPPASCPPEPVWHPVQPGWPRLRLRYRESEILYSVSIRSDQVGFFSL